MYKDSRIIIQTTKYYIINMRKIIFLLGLVALGVIISCERDTESMVSNDQQNALNLTGQWEVMAYNDTVSLIGPFTVLTVSDPASNNDSITIQDSEVKFWKFQVKAAVDAKDGSFETKLSKCEVSDVGIGVKISNGKILNSDSIYFEIQFEDDVTPYGNTYQLKGHRVNG